MAGNGGASCGDLGELVQRVPATELLQRRRRSRRRAKAVLGVYRAAVGRVTRV